MALTKQQQETIDRMIMAGKTFDAVAKELGGNVSWVDIQQYAWESGNMSWQGSMKMISTRLKKLRTATKESERVKLGNEVQARAKYLYNCAKAMRDKLEKIEKVMK